jgi:signal transduction histidine kinase/AmiR/NasT family two-component response regulator
VKTVWHVETDYFALIIFVIMLVRNQKFQAERTQQDRMFKIVLWVSIFSALIDLISSEAMNQASDWWFYQISLTIYYVTMPLLAAVWMSYAITVISTDEWKVTQMAIAISLIPYVVYALIAGSNPWTGLFFGLSSSMEYTRGPLFWPIGVGFTTFYPAAGILLVLMQRRQIKPRSNMYLLISFFAADILSLWIQLYHPGWLIINASYACVYVLCDMTIETERRNELYERLRSQNQSLVEATEAKSEFFSRVSHDMRTPMNGILGIANLALQEDDVQSIKSDVTKIRDAGEYMLSLINDTLDTQRIESGNLHLNYQPVNGSLLMESVVTMVQSTAATKNIRFSVSNKNAIFDCWIYTDPIRIKQIFVNLISNAIKFTPPGGKVVMNVECLDRSNDCAKDLFELTDNGVGMSEEFLRDKLFKPFAQEHNTQSDQYAGSGLGLSIVKSLVEKMGGSIAVRSELGKGTTFSVRLDIQKLSKEEAEKMLAEQKSSRKASVDVLKGRRILICEDNHLNAEIARRLLEKTGCIVETAVNGAEGLQKFQDSAENYYDAVIMDIRMPVMNGLEAAKAIRRLRRTDAGTVPIIAMTANAFAEDVQASAAAGMDAHLAKPIQVQQLYETLAGFIGAKSQEEPHRMKEEPR